MFKTLCSATIVGLLSFSVHAGNGCCPNDGGWDYCSDTGYLHCDDGSVSKACTCKNIPDPESEEMIDINKPKFDLKTANPPTALFEKIMRAGSDKPT